MFRALPLLVVLVGVVASRRQGNHATQPIISEAQQQRICADLCRAGLGGEACGEVCFDLMPTGIPLQSPNDIRKVDEVKKTRSDACPVLCKNRLGYPLCQCQILPQSKNEQRKFRVDFEQICDYYCEHQKWVLRGCPNCTHAAPRQDGLKALFLQDGAMTQKMVNLAVPGTSFTSAAGAGRQVDWEKWCTLQCEKSNGGSACNCDLIPFMLQI